MGSKGIVILGLFLAMVFLISSEVAARELAETSNTVDTSKETEVNDAKYPGGGYGGYPGGGYGGGYPGRGGNGGGYPGGGGNGGGYPGHGGRHGGGHGGGRGGCRYGCCGRNYYGRGCRCCSYAGEKADAEVEAQPHN